MLPDSKPVYLSVLILFFVYGCAGGKSEQLVLAASEGDVLTVRRLLDEGVSVESTALDGLSPLKAAAKAGQLDVVKLLVARGASVNGGQRNNDTPLRYAATYENTEVCVFSLAHGGEIRGTRQVNDQFLQAISADNNQRLFELIRDQLQREYARSPSKEGGLRRWF